MAMWYPVMVVVAAWGLALLTLGPVALVVAVVELDGWRLIRAAWAVLAGAGIAAWWFKEWKSWRRLTPRVLRDGRPPRPVRHNRILAWFEQGYEEGKREAEAS